MIELQLTPATVAILLAVAALAVLAVRRLVRKGLCDCHADKGCSGCAGCPKAGGCAAADAMVERMKQL